jgi:hypothetical protein
MKAVERPKNGQLSVVLGDELRVLFSAWCREHAITPSKKIRAMLQDLCVEVPHTEHTTTAGVVDIERVRFHLRLPKSQFDALENIAKLRGEKSAQALAAAVLRGFLSKNPHYSASELQTLGESNYQLLRIGTSLNQIAKQLNASGGASTGQELQSVAADIKAHVAKVAGYLSESNERWVIEKI